MGAGYHTIHHTTYRHNYGEMPALMPQAVVTGLFKRLNLVLYAVINVPVAHLYELPFSC